MVRVGDYKHNPRTLEYIHEVITSDRLNQGKYTKMFEDTFKRDHQCQHALFVNSGTSALHLALQAMKIAHKWGDDAEVIIPATTFVATYNVVVHNKLKPVLVDIDLDDYGMNPDNFAAAITKRTVAVIPVHLFGQPCKIDEIVETAAKQDIKVIEDSCEAMYCGCNGTPVGGWGDIACFSTYVAHVLTTGVGGFVTTNNQEYADLCKSLTNHGRDLSSIDIDDKGDFAKRFQFNHIGHSFRMTDMEAAVGVAQIEEIDELIERRREVARKLSEGLKYFPLVLPKVKPDCTHSFMMYPILYSHRDDLCAFLEENGVETRPFVSLTDQPCYDLSEVDHPNARTCNKIGFYIGSHPYITDEDIDTVLDVFGKFFEGAAY